MLFKKKYVYSFLRAAVHQLEPVYGVSLPQVARAELATCTDEIRLNRILGILFNRCKTKEKNIFTYTPKLNLNIYTMCQNVLFSYSTKFYSYKSRVLNENESCQNPIRALMT
jgi:hypothetical protein